MQDVNTERERPMNNIKENITAPVDIVKQDFIKIFEKSEIKERIENMNFMETIYIPFDDNYKKPTKDSTLFEVGKKIITAKVINNSLVIKKSTDFHIEDVIYVEHRYNNKSREKNKQYLILGLVSENGYKKDVEIIDNEKGDANKFQESLNRQDNHFQVVFSQREFKTFKQDFIISKVSKKVIIYENCGVIAPQRFLGGDFYICEGNVYYQNEQKLIPTEEPNIFIKASEDKGFILPQISRSKKSPQEVAKHFVQNICDSWGSNSTLALLIIGHMIMGLFYDYYSKETEGSPVLIIQGISGCGKSTLVANGLAIFGLDNKFLIAGNSTTNGQFNLAQSINCVNICVDDLSDNLITSKYFEQIVKNLFSATPRATSINYGKSTNFKFPCSQVIYSTNGMLPEISQLENRVNTVTIMHNSLNTTKYQYLNEHTSNRSELSLILPKLMEFDLETVILMQKKLKSCLRDSINFQNVPRIDNNIAYMWTGLKLLLNIAEYEPENLFEDIINYTKETVHRYKNLTTPVDMLINSLITLKNRDVIREDIDYKLKQVDGRVYFTFHKETLLSIYNNFFREDERKIRINVLNHYLKADKRVIDPRKTGYYQGERKNSVVLDISDWEDVWEFSGYTPVNKPASIDVTSDSLDELNEILNCNI